MKARSVAVRQLEDLLKGKNLALARSARLALEKIAEEDDSRRVSQLAAQALEEIRQAEQLAGEEAEKERLAEEKAEAERRPAKLEAQHLAALKAQEESKREKSLHKEL